METEYKTPPEKFTAFLKRQKMIFIVAFLRYVCAYLVRNNFKLMSKSIMVANEWTKDDIAMLLSCLTVSYGLAKFYMGALGDKVSLRKLFSLCLAASAIICIIIGFYHTSVAALAVLLVLCGVVQGALAPASQAMIANYYPNRTRGAAIAGWNISQNLGSAMLPMMIAGMTTMGWIVPNTDHVLAAFIVPAVLVLAFAAFCWKYGGDKPENEGLDSRN